MKISLIILLFIFCLFSCSKQTSKIVVDENIDSTPENVDSLFNYSISENGIIITSLTDLGNNKEKIELPESINDILVVDYSSELFISNNIVHQILFPITISTIYIESLTTLDTLKSIVLMHENASMIKFDLWTLNINFDIYVPQGTRSNYVMDFNWSFYSDRIYELNSSF